MHTPTHTLQRFLLSSLLAMSMCGGLAFLSTPASAQTPPAKSASSHKDLIRLLSAHHELPERALFEEIGPDVVKRLHAVIGSKDALRAHKYRALEALATYWPGKDTTTLFGALFASPEHDLMLHQLMAISSRHLPAAEAASLIAPYLSHADEQIRYSAVDALGRIDTATTRELLRGARKSEKSDWIKEHIDAMVVELR